MLINKEKDMTPFDMSRKPVKQNPILVVLLWIASFFMTRPFRLRIRKVGMKGKKGPFLVISTHQGFSDYYIAPLVLFPHRANYVSDMEGFAAFGNWLYRSGGCIGKRRYVSDASVMKNIRYCLFRLKKSVVVFPESRHCNVGTTSLIPPNMGKLVKHLGVPVAVLSVHGSYLANPFWDEERTRKSRMEATLEYLYSAEEVQRLSSEEIQRTIEKKLTYDEYRWQWEQKLEIKDAKRAEGLHKPLYQCLECCELFSMKSSGSILYCEACGSRWKMDAYGRLMDTHGQPVHIPNWYEWERQQVMQEIDAGEYGLDIEVQVEALPNEKGFVKLGNGRLTHDKEKYILTVGDDLHLEFKNRNLESVQTEYNYRGKGKCIVLSTKDCCYYVYSKNPEFCVTKLQFATEYV
ncbi:MAG: 1-acyl-sn-glycerol-3-phosphate acyltransferase [Lachnospiraceae bacterium]|nr:1-acyl-sn-glycerol-3-phosphate acyltransferase [Lachnospiraceae bacterium]